MLQAVCKKTRIHAPGGEPPPRPVCLALYLPAGPSGKGFFSLDSQAGHITAELSPAETRLLLLLDRAYDRDADLAPVLQGWRSIEQLIALVEYETSYPLDSQTISQYLWRIKRAFDKAAALTGLDVPAWREVKRGAGMRLVDRLTVIDGNQRERSAACHRSATTETNGGPI